jgi:hypothetical protein
MIIMNLILQHIRARCNECSICLFQIVHFYWNFREKISEGKNTPRMLQVRLTTQHS